LAPVVEQELGRPEECLDASGGEAQEPLVQRVQSECESEDSNDRREEGDEQEIVSVAVPLPELALTEVIIVLFFHRLPALLLDAHPQVQ